MKNKSQWIDLTPIELLDEIADRRAHMNGMVGTLYPSVVEGEICEIAAIYTEKVEAMRRLEHPVVEHPSLEDTAKHHRRVMMLLTEMAHALNDRGLSHDQSKFEDPELAVFDEFTPKLAGATYGSPKYKAFLAAMKPALDHHYYNNRHHPEHFSNGIDGMHLIDLVEMLCDWKAAGERHKDGDLVKSIKINQERFKISDQLLNILLNTVRILE